MKFRYCIHAAFFATLTLLLLSGSAVAQAMKVPQTDRGFYQYTSFGIAHDDAAGWVSETGLTVGYDFNRRVSVESGIPFYVVRTTETSGTASATSSGAGDWFARVIVTPISNPFHYATAFTLTAPTGNADIGVSSGQASWNWLNHLDKSVSRLTPFLEAGLTNSLTGDRRYQRAFTTSGTAATLRGGAGFDVWKFVSAELSGYTVQGIGSQKIYSRKVKAAASIPTPATGHKPAFETQYLTTGDSSLVEDNGFTTAIYANPNQRLDFALAYNRSMTYDLNTVSATLGFRLGHIQKKTNGQ